MSRLDSFLRRITAQRDCLNAAAAMLGDLPGPVIELGLGNGRTFDHLRTLFPARALFAFDRRNAADPASAPPPERLILGEFSETLPSALKLLGAPAAFAHLDFGSGRPAHDAGVARALWPLLEPLLAKGALVASDQAVPAPHWLAVALPPGVKAERYFLYRLG
jgi:hypothetical protein